MTTAIQQLLHTQRQQRDFSNETHPGHIYMALPQQKGRAVFCSSSPPLPPPPPPLPPFLGGLKIGSLITDCNPRMGFAVLTGRADCHYLCLTSPASDVAMLAYLNNISCTHCLGHGDVNI